MQKDSASGQPCSNPGIFNASWFTGPVAGHPDQTLLTAAGINNNALKWGRVGASRIGTPWEQGDILGAAQSGNSLLLRNYGPEDNVSDGELTFLKCESEC
jgi:hypothetical protein